MSLIQDTKDIQSAFDQLKRKAETQQHLYFSVITGVVKLHQEYRIAKNYEVSDKLRDLLHANGIKIVQGTKQYGSYENIPKNLINNTVDDRWVLL
jgi:cysteinyl-tRNA synthetase